MVLFGSRGKRQPEISNNHGGNMQDHKDLEVTAELADLEVTAELAAELEPVVLANVSEITGTGGSQVEDDNIVWGNI
jgi:hypothetical protein